MKKTLSLQKETIRLLNDKAMRFVAGGLPTEDSNIGEFCATTVGYPSCQHTVCMNDTCRRDTCATCRC